MQAAYWGMHHFSTYLKGHKFILFTDHKPLEKLSTVQTKTLARINEYMGTYNFDIRHKKGNEMPADYLSRHPIDEISFRYQDENVSFRETLFVEQYREQLCQELKYYLDNRKVHP
jgi:hypothetical protein